MVMQHSPNPNAWKTFGLIFLCLHACHCGLHEKRLLAHLFNASRPDAYNPLERPVRNETQPLEVHIKFILNQLMDVDLKNQIITTSIRLEMHWTNYHFRWDPAEYNGIKMINVHPTLMWRPDILLYNSANEQFDVTFPVNVGIYYDGNITYYPPGRFQSNCDMNITWFPFDTQECKLKYGSWTFQGDSIDLRAHCTDRLIGRDDNESCPADTHNFIEHGEWHMKEAQIVRNVKRYDCCPESYIDLTLTLKLRRKPLYYAFNLIIPCMLISFLSLLVFSLPPQAEEKVILGVTILLSLTMFLVLVANYIPQTSDAVPILGIYFFCIIMLCTMSMFFTTIVLHLHTHPSKTPAPRFISVYINHWLARALFMTPAPIPQAAPSPDKSTVVKRDMPFTGDAANIQTISYMASNNAGIPGTTDYNLWKSPVMRNEQINKQKPQRQTPQQWPGTSPISKDVWKGMESLSLLSNVRGVEDTRSAWNPQVSSPWSPAASVTPETMRGKHNKSAFGQGKASASGDIAWNPNSYFRPIDTHRDTSFRENPDAGAENAKTPTTSSKQNKPGSSSKTGESTLADMFKPLRSILKEMRTITHKMTDDDDESTMMKEWQFASGVIDRLCLILFTLATILVTVIMLLIAPDVV